MRIRIGKARWRNFILFHCDARISNRWNQIWKLKSSRSCLIPCNATWKHESLCTSIRVSDDDHQAVACQPRVRQKGLGIRRSHLSLMRSPNTDVYTCAALCIHVAVRDCRARSHATFALDKRRNGQSGLMLNVYRAICGDWIWHCATGTCSIFT